MSEEIKPKQKRQRRVWGRMRRTFDGKDFIFEMTPLGLQVREVHSRKDPAVIPFSDLHAASQGQFKLL